MRPSWRHNFEEPRSIISDRSLFPNRAGMHGERFGDARLTLETGSDFAIGVTNLAFRTIVAIGGIWRLPSFPSTRNHLHERMLSLTIWNGGQRCWALQPSDRAIAPKPSEKYADQNQTGLSWSFQGWRAGAPGAQNHQWEEASFFEIIPGYSGLFRHRLDVQHMRKTNWAL